MPSLESVPRDFAFQILNPLERNLWKKLNYLVIGPPGSGKLSLALALSRSLTPKARILLCDWETEETCQAETLDRLQTHLGRHFQGSRAPIEEIIILRHIHRLSLPLLGALVESLSPVLGGEGREESATGPYLRATCHEPPACPASLAERVQLLFPCEIRLTGTPQARGDLTQFLKDLIRELNHRHGRRITEIESTVVDQICRLAPGSSFHELRAVIERAYIESTGPRLSVLSND